MRCFRDACIGLPRASATPWDTLVICFSPFGSPKPSPSLTIPCFLLKICRTREVREGKYCRPFFLTFYVSCSYGATWSGHLKSDLNSAKQHFPLPSHCLFNPSLSVHHLSWVLFLHFRFKMCFFTQAIFGIAKQKLCLIMLWWVKEVMQKRNAALPSPGQISKGHSTWPSKNSL